MAKTRTPKPPKPAGATKPTDPSEVVVEYDLFDLPTAFHKAGLAGLILLIESLKARQELNADEPKYEVTATGATVTFTEKLVGKLFDDMYDAEPGQAKEGKAGSRKKKAEAAEVVKKPKEAPPIPKLKALRDMLPDGDELWVKLWRDMIFQAPRSQPATWKPYKDRIAGHSYRLKDRDPWADLQRFDTGRRNGQSYTGKLSGSLLLGIQEENPEMVPCQGWLHQNLLLHFWLLAVLLFAPQQLKAEKRNGELQITTDPAGFTLAVPDVSNLKEFVRDYPRLLASLTKDMRGYRPAQAVIDLPAEGALAFLDDLAVLTGLQVETGELRFSIGAIEYLHVFKEKRNVKMMTAGRVAPNRRLLSGYRAIASPKDETTRYRNPLFRRGLLIALLDGLEWYQSFGNVFSTFDAEVLIRQRRKTEDEKGPPQFATDAAKKFRHETKLFVQTLKRSIDMPDTPRPTAPPAVIVNRVVRSYLLARTQEKTGIDPEQYKTLDGETDYKAIPTEFNEAKQKLALSLILEFRSRREQAFVDHFATTFFSVTQRLTEPDRLELASLLTVADRRDDLKNLVLLSLSANS
jgi:CRISPR-associated protein Cmx8